MPLLVGGPARAGNVFLAGEDLKKLELFEMHTSFEPGAQMLFRHKWSKLDTLLSYFIVLVNKVASLIGMSFLICGSGFRLKISRIALLLKHSRLDSKTDLTTDRLISESFWWYMPRFVYILFVRTKICKNCSIVFLFWRRRLFDD